MNIKKNKKVENETINVNFQEKIIKQQLEKLKTQKNVIIDIDENEAIEYLKEHNYTKIFTSNKELFVTPKYKNDYYLKTKNKKILREFKQGLRCEIKTQGNIEMSDILNCLKNQETGKHQYLESVNFSDLRRLNEQQDELSLQQITKLHKIEDILKSAITHFMLTHVNGDWKYWLLSIVKKSKPNTKERVLRMLNKLFDIITKNNGKNKSPNRWKELDIPTQHIVNEMSLGDLKECVDFILYSTLETNIKDELFDSLVVHNPYKKFKYSNLTYEKFIHNLGLINKFRNSTMHFEKLLVFILKERVYEISKLKSNLNWRIWVIPNKNEDKSMKYFLQNYHKLQNQDSHNISKNFILNDIKLGYYVEVENINTGKLTSLDLKIFKILDWWLK